MNSKIATVKLTPVFPMSFFDCIFSNEKIDGCIIECYGVGNFPTERKDILAELETACNKGKVIVYIT